MVRDDIAEYASRGHPPGVEIGIDKSLCPDPNIEIYSNIELQRIIVHKPILLLGLQGVYFSSI